MPVPLTMADLAVTAATCNPPGGEIIGTQGDDYHRALQAIVRRESAKGADRPIVGGILTPGNDGYYFVVTTVGGTLTGITNTWAGRQIVLVFSGGVTIVNSPTLILPGGGNILTSSARVYGFVQETATPVWRCIFNDAVTGPQGIQGPQGPQGIQGLQGPAGPSGNALIERRAFNAVASVQFLLTQPLRDLYSEFAFRLGPSLVTSFGASINIQFSINGGATYPTGFYTGVQEFYQMGPGAFSAAGHTGTRGSPSTSVPVTGVSNAGAFIYGNVQVEPSLALVQSTAFTRSDPLDQEFIHKCWGRNEDLTGVTAVRFLPSAGGVMSGKIDFIGIR